MRNKLQPPQKQIRSSALRGVQIFRIAKCEDRIKKLLFKCFQGNKNQVCVSCSYFNLFSSSRNCY